MQCGKNIEKQTYKTIIISYNTEVNMRNMRKKRKEVTECIKNNRRERERWKKYLIQLFQVKEN